MLNPPCLIHSQPLFLIMTDWWTRVRMQARPVLRCIHRVLNNGWNAKSHQRYQCTDRPSECWEVVSPVVVEREAKPLVTGLKLQSSCYAAVVTILPVSSTCPLPSVHTCMSSLDWMCGMCVPFPPQSLQVCCNEKKTCFLLWGRKRTEGTASIINADSEFINLPFCKSKCNWTRLQKSTRLSV